MSTQKDPASPWLTRQELAKYLKLSLRKVDYMTAAGELPLRRFWSGEEVSPGYH